MISKEIFCKCLDAIKEEDERNENISKTIERYSSSYVVLDSSPTHQCLIDLLCDVMGDKAGEDGETMIEWWLYEDVEKFLYDRETGDIMDDLTAPESLYDYLAKRIVKK